MKHWFSKLAVLALVALPLAAETGHLRIRSSPVGAGLFVDGKYVGPAGRFSVPEKWPVEAGSHEITLKDPRYEDFTAKVDVKSGKTTKLRAKLKKLEEPKGPFGRLRLKGGEPESFWSVAQGDTGRQLVAHFRGGLGDIRPAPAQMKFVGQVAVKSVLVDFRTVEQRAHERGLTARGVLQ